MPAIGVITAARDKGKGYAAAAKAIPLWSDVQRKVKQRMGETLWNELMGNLSQFVKVADQLNELK